MYVASPIPKNPALIEIIPLIEIMLYLLASFIMVSLSQTLMKGIKVNLPAQGAPPTTVTKDYVAIRVSPGNAIFFDGQFVQDDQVLPRLFQLHSANPNIKISISDATMSTHGHVIATLDKVRRVGKQTV